MPQPRQAEQYDGQPLIPHRQPEQMSPLPIEGAGLALLSAPSPAWPRLRFSCAQRSLRPESSARGKSPPTGRKNQARLPTAPGSILPKADKSTRSLPQEERLSPYMNQRTMSFLSTYRAIA